MENEIRIIPPEGMEIDRANSTFECIKFKPKLTYDNVAKKLFNNNYYFISNSGEVFASSRVFSISSVNCPNNGTSRKQLEKLLAINKLMNVAKYLNGDWKPDWSITTTENKYYIGVGGKNIYVNNTNTNNESVCYFKSPELAQKAINILGEDTIRLAFSNDY